MPLTDPELDLLQELLEENPEEDVFVQVGEELNRRLRWNDAYTVIKRGLQANPHEKYAWSLLARSALEIGEYGTSLNAWERCGSQYQNSLDLSRVRILALERAGRPDEAKLAIDEFELTHGTDDVVVSTARERLDAPPPERSQCAYDPFLTVAHAERYAALGRVDRAIRIYHRILFRYPDDVALRTRIDQLHGYLQDVDDFTDLSEELFDPALVPPDLTMPSPQITSASVEPATSRQMRPIADRSKPQGLQEFMSSSRAAQREGKAPDTGRRKRRSLLKR